MITLDQLDRDIIAATQTGLPLTARPYLAVAEQVGCDEAELIRRLQALLAAGAIRRIGVIPNHYRLGYTANGMSVWDIPDEAIVEAGESVGALPFVSHCYQRPRHLPQWPYNFFAMVHGKSRAEVIEKVEAVAEALQGVHRAHRILFSSRILKKTGLRLGASRA